MSEHRIDEVFDDLSTSDPFFGELARRLKLNSMWREIVGDFLASQTHVCAGKDGVLLVWGKDSTVLSEVRFKSRELLSEFKKRGMDFTRIKVSRS